MRAAALLFLVALGGCAISEGEYETMAHTASAKNEARYKRAARAFEKRGYRFVDESFYISPPDELVAYCRSTQTWDNAAVSLAITPPRAPARSVTTRRDDACALFANRSTKLEVTDASGAPTTLFKLERNTTLARERSNKLFLVAIDTNVLFRRTVLVKRSCDHMPGIDRNPFDVPTAILVISAPRLPATVTMTVDEEQLEMECTENTY